MNSPLQSANRLVGSASQSASAHNLRLSALILCFVAINQIDEPLVGATLAEDLLYWFVRLATLALGLWGANHWLSQIADLRLAQPSWLKPVVLVSAIGLLPFSLAEILIERQLPIRPEYSDDALWEVSPFLAWFSEYVTIVTILLPVHFLLWLIVDRRSAPSERTDESQLPPLPEFLEPTTIRRVDQVLALQAEEHYVRVITEAGSELVHCRFKNAVAAMPEQLGLRVHRSWWVAKDAVVGARRGERRWQLELVREQFVPVSDSYLKAVRSEGLLSRRSRPRKNAT